MTHDHLERLMRLTTEGDAAAASELRRHLDRISPPPALTPPLNMQAIASLRVMVRDLFAGGQLVLAPWARFPEPHPLSEQTLPVPGTGGDVWAWVALACGGLRLEYREAVTPSARVTILRGAPATPSENPEQTLADLIDLIRESCFRAGVAAASHGANPPFTALGLLPIIDRLGRRLPERAFMEGMLSAAWDGIGNDFSAWLD